MCGIAGYILHERRPAEAGRMRLLMEGMRLRGPDDEGALLVDRSSRAGTPGMAGVADVALIHARFAIIDLSSGGHQPFFSQDGSCAVIFNGEIYNYVEIKEELAVAGIACRSASDTEVLVEGWRLWGHGLWPRLNGFWAVALYDKISNAVILCRDRLGVAPLYYRETSEGFFFSSLIEPLCQLAPGGRGMDRDVVQGFIDTGLKDFEDKTVYHQVRSLPAACAVVFSYGKPPAWGAAEIYRYWDFPQQPLLEKDVSLEAAARELREALKDAVRLRLRADVPVAFELSGGLDSSSVVAMAAELSDRKITAYTIRVRSRDETPYARAMARRFNLDHRVFDDIEQDLPRDAGAFAAVMEEPYDTPANYVHHRMLKTIRADGFKVVLTGAGGDEVLAGYEASFWPGAWRAWRRQGLRQDMQAQWYEFCRRFRSWPQAGHTVSGYGRFLQRMVGVKGAVHGNARPSRALALTQGYAAMDYYSQRLFHCQVGLLPYYLRSTDHYTLNIPVEHRFPLLDYRLVEMGMKMPVAYLFRGGWAKYVLRRAMAGRLPGEVLWRKKKMGFPFDFASYFQGRDKDFERYLKVAARAGFVDEKAEQYADLARRDPVRLWRILSVGIWLDSRSDLL